MKIGILTFHRAHNYGAILQAYALKQYLSMLGYDVEIIDYWPEYRAEMYQLIDFSFLNNDLALFKRFKKLVRQLIQFPQNFIRHTRFDTFIANHCQVSSQTVINDGALIKNDFDLYITGSDQVWRYNNFSKFKGFDPVYWGKYPEETAGKKCSYAASMGVIRQGIDEDFIKDNISNFDMISVRENNLKAYLSQLTEKEILTVVDPVLLLDKSEWCKLINDHKPKTKKYILFYQLNKSSKACALVKCIARVKNLKVIELKGGVSPFCNPRKTKQLAGPIQFIELFANAEYVVSTSFHGLVFSIVFKKQFFVLGLGDNSGRATSLLEQLTIQDRYINKQDDITNVVDCTDIIDFVKVHSKLKSLQDFTKKYISLMLNHDEG